MAGDRLMTSGRTIGIAVALVLAAAAYVAWFGLPPPQPGPPPHQTSAPAATTGPAAPPTTSPGAAEDLGSKALITDKAIRENAARSRYIHDTRLPGGTLRGVCYVKHDKPVRLYPPFPIELEGKHAIRNPRKGELRYYQSRKPLPVSYLGYYAPGEKRYGVNGAVIMIHDVKAGARRDFDRLRYQVDFRNHQIVPSKPQGRGVFNPSACGIGVMRVRQLVQALNLCLYDSHLTLTNLRTGKVAWEQILEKYHDPKFPGEHLGFNPVMQRPTVHQIPRINEKGFYALTCKRHPWQRAHLLLWDSPYVTVTATGSRDMQRYPEQVGAFAIDRIPEGTHTVEVWHPQFEPLKRTFQVDVAMDQITPLSVEFKAPPVLSQTPPPLPDTLIGEWACIGPFYPLMDEEPDAPNNKLDFAATYDGMEDDIAWKRIKTAGGRDQGYVLLHKAMWRLRELSLSYYAVKVISPKAQRLYLAVHNQSDALTAWLNGSVVFKSYTGDFDRYTGRCRDWFIITGQLEPGENTLLLMISAERTERARFAVKYRAQGVTLKVPLK